MRLRLLFIMIVIALLVLSGCTDNTTQVDEPVQNTVEPNDTRPQITINYGDSIDKDEITKSLLTQTLVDETIDISFLKNENFDTTQLIELDFKENIQDAFIEYTKGDLKIKFTNNSYEIFSDATHMTKAQYDDIIIGETTFDEIKKLLNIDNTFNTIIEIDNIIYTFDENKILTNMTIMYGGDE